MTTLAEVRARFARDQGLPFADSLTELSILDALNEHGVQYRDRLFNPITTIWGFLSQVLSDDHRCRDAVARVVAHRTSARWRRLLVNIGGVDRSAHEPNSEVGRYSRRR